LPRHLHDAPYIAVVLAGHYVEAGDTGRHRVEAGHVIRHAPFESHLNRFDHGPAEVLVLTAAADGAEPLGTVGDPDRIARLAERDVEAALACLAEQFAPRPTEPADWPDLLAQRLLAEPGLSLRHWAHAHGLNPGSLSRGFFSQFGVTPARFRSLAKFHRARRLMSGPLGLAEIAVAAGFADQPHLSREVRRSAGLTASMLAERVRSWQGVG
jgi:AraC-like DNA-binding protein